MKKINTIRIIGLIILGIGYIVHFTLENDATDFIPVLLAGIGIGFIISG